jgi:tetratricopeptide (TPR) repeat protein
METSRFIEAIYDNDDDDENQAFQEILELPDNAKVEEAKEYDMQYKERGLRDQRVSKIYNKAFGIAKQYLEEEDDPILFELRDKWAIRLRTEGDVHRAIHQNIASVRAHKRVHGENHPATLDARQRLGECYAAIEEYDKAVGVYDNIIAAYLADPLKSDCRDQLGLSVAVPATAIVENTSVPGKDDDGNRRVAMESLRSGDPNATKAHCKFVEEILKDHDYEEASNQLKAIVSALQDGGQDTTIESLDNEMQISREKIAMMLGVCHLEAPEHRTQGLYTDSTVHETDSQRHDEGENFSVNPLRTESVVKVQEENKSRNPPSKEQGGEEHAQHPLLSDIKDRDSCEKIAKHQCLPIEKGGTIPRVDWSHAKAGTEALTGQDSASNTTEHTSTTHGSPNALPSLQLIPEPKEMPESIGTTAQPTLGSEIRNLPSLQCNGSTCEDSYRPMPGAWPTDWWTPPETPKLSRSCSTRSLRCDSLLSPLKPDARRHSVSTEPRKLVDFAPSVPISQSWTSEE